MSTDSYTPSQEPGSKRLKTGESVFARRGVSPSTGGVASAYGNESEKKPSWLQTNKSDIDGKYDKYGERRNAHTTTRDSRLDRLKRVRQKLAEREDVGHEGDEGDEDEGILPYIHLQAANPAIIHNEKQENYRTFQSRISNRE